MKAKITRCGAVTRRGRPCRNPAEAGGFCRLHAPPKPASEHGASPLPADPIGRLELLQDAAERRALEAHRAGEDGNNGKLDASFNRNARLAATLARARLALARAQAKGDEAAAEGEEESSPDFELPDNKRE